MTSTKEEGGVVINYSNRFTLNGLTGDTALKFRHAAQALDGNTDGPSAVGNAAPSTSSSATSTSSSSSTASEAANRAPTSDAATTTSSPKTADPSTSSPSAPTALPEDTSPSSNLSRGAIAGVAVAATIAVIALGAALAWYLYVRRRRKQSEVQEIAPGHPFQQKPMSELSAEELLRPKAAWTHHTELSSDSMVHEAGSGERLPELDHTVFRAELEGSQPSTPK